MTLLDPQPRPLDDPGRCTDAELICAVRAGDRSAYARLYERHEPAARRMARQLSASPHDVDDLVAEAFARVFDMLNSGRGPDSAFRAYLLTAVRNGMYERARRDRRVELSEDMGRHDPGVPWVDPAEAELNSALAVRAFASLPERWRTVLWYSEVEQESTAELGSRLGLRPNAVAALAYRAREGLRQAFLQAHVTGADDAACRDTVARLGGWTRDRLSSGDTARVDAHLDSCRRCRQVAAELAEVNSSLRGVLPLVLLGGVATGSLVHHSAGAASAAAGAGAAGAAATASAGASAGALSGGPAGAVAGASVLGWLAGANAGPVAAVLTAVVVGGTAVAAGVAVPHVVHHSQAPSAVRVPEAGIAGGQAEFAPVTPSADTANPVRKNAAAKRATAAEKAKSQGTGSNAATTGSRANGPANGRSDAARSTSQADAAGNGQTEPPKPPQGGTTGTGHTGGGQAGAQTDPQTDPQPRTTDGGQAGAQTDPQPGATGGGQTSTPTKQAGTAGAQTEAGTTGGAQTRSATSAQAGTAGSGQTESPTSAQTSTTGARQLSAPTRPQASATGGAQTRSATSAQAGGPGGAQTRSAANVRAGTAGTRQVGSTGTRRVSAPGDPQTATTAQAPGSRTATGGQADTPPADAVATGPASVSTARPSRSVLVASGATGADSGQPAAVSEDRAHRAGGSRP